MSAPPEPGIPIPERLSGDGVCLRPLREDDVEPYAAAYAEDRELGRWLGVEHDPTPSDVRERMRSAVQGAAESRWLELAIATVPGDGFAGTALVHSIALVHRRCEIGFWIVGARRRQGLAAAAVARLLNWLFDERGFERVEMTTTPDNARLRALARRLGFVEEGVLRARNFERGRRVDLIAFGLLREEWPAAGV